MLHLLRKPGVVTLIILATLCLLMFFQTAALIGGSTLPALDRFILELQLPQTMTPGTKGLMEFFSMMADFETQVGLMMGFAVTLLIRQLLRKDIGLQLWSWFFAVNTYFWADMAKTYLKLVFERPRPLGADLALAQYEHMSNAFPSGHATRGFCVYGFLAYLVLRHGTSPLRFLAVFPMVLLMILTGLSRIYLGVHYTTDVIAGFALGGFILILMIGLYEWTLSTVNSARQ